ncbi:hypothetical protein AVEN_247512-1 [Araneus ventricosus]|uniref:PiggyBac transposable element-derived protein domain-containing protein n=1 Tax=Araneus ventricosus TaxID=182803 RepID=A0A4Y2LI37_ARAVE|nr:hypothetical protein AVEN_247512-1 [Araneus ventricosus]
MNSDSDTEYLIEKESSDEEFSSSESESDDDSLESARDWCRVDITISHPSHPKFPFTGNPGLKVSVGDSEDPLDYLTCFLMMIYLTLLCQKLTGMLNHTSRMPN